MIPKLSVQAILWKDGYKSTEDSTGLSERVFCLGRPGEALATSTSCSPRPTGPRPAGEDPHPRRQRGVRKKYDLRLRMTQSDINTFAEDETEGLRIYKARKRQVVAVTVDATFKYKFISSIRGDPHVSEYYEVQDWAIASFTAQHIEFSISKTEGSRSTRMGYHIGTSPRKRPPNDRALLELELDRKTRNVLKVNVTQEDLWVEFDYPGKLTEDHIQQDRRWQTVEDYDWRRKSIIVTTFWNLDPNSDATKPIVDEGGRYLKGRGAQVNRWGNDKKRSEEQRICTWEIWREKRN